MDLYKESTQTSVIIQHVTEYIPQNFKLKQLLIKEITPDNLHFFEL